MLIAHQCMMGSYVAYLLFAVLFPTSTVSEAVRDEPTTWNKDESPLKMTHLQIPTWIPDIVQSCVPGVRTVQGSSNKESSQPNVVININNFFCITGMQDVNVDPIKKHIFNIAVGNQELNFPQASDIAGTQLKTTKPIFEIPTKNKDTQRGALLTYGEQSHGSRNPDSRVMLNEYLNGRNGLPKNDCWDFLHRRVFEIPLTINAKTNYEEYNQVKDIFSCKAGLDTSASKIDPLENRRLNSWSIAPKITGSNYESAPNLKLFIGGKRVNESQGNQNTQNDKPSSSNYNETMEAVLNDKGYIGIGKQSSFCDSEDHTKCNHDVITFREGFELTYDQFEQIFKEITDMPEHIKLIVPGGVTGPLLPYFQQVETNHHELALQHGVCLLSNGFLIPIKPMLRLIQLHGWLSGLNPNLMSESFRLLHMSIWTDMKSVLGMLQCLIKSGKVKVVLPSNQKISFDQFEQQEHQAPNILLEQMKVELIGFSIPYDIFKSGLLELCKTVGTSMNI